MDSNKRNALPSKQGGAASSRKTFPSWPRTISRRSLRRTATRRTAVRNPTEPPELSATTGTELRRVSCATAQDSSSGRFRPGAIRTRTKSSRSATISSTPPELVSIRTPFGNRVELEMEPSVCAPVVGCCDQILAEVKMNIIKKKKELHVRMMAPELRNRFLTFAQNEIRAAS